MAAFRNNTGLFPRKVNAFVILTAVSFVIGPHLFCGDTPSGTDEDPIIDVGVSVDAPKGDDRDSLIFFVNEKVTIRATVISPEAVDTLSVRFIRNPDSSITDDDLNALHGKGEMIEIIGEIEKKITLSHTFTAPGEILLVVVGAGGNDSRFRTLKISIVEGENTAPVITLTPYHTYASPSFPCSLSVAVENDEPWQSVARHILNPQEHVKMYDDTLCVWIPGEKDVDDSLAAIIIRATDDGDKPESDTDTVYVVLIQDDDVPVEVANIRVAERTDEAVALSWDKNMSADGYVVLKGDSPDADEWEEFPVADTFFTDSTGEVHYYRVKAENIFGQSLSDETVAGCDTLHYAHVIAFADDLSITSEDATELSVDIVVSAVAEKDITVNVAVDKVAADDDDFTLGEDEITIEKGSDKASVVLTINDDAEDDGTDTLLLKIAHVSSGLPMGQTVHTVVIKDNDRFYSVTYNENGADDGDVPVDDKRYRYGASAKVASNSGELVKEGYTFDEWNTKSDGGGAGYKGGSSIEINGKNITLYAQWSINQYSVTYDGNGNDSGVPPEKVSVNYHDSVTVAGNSGNLEKKGYVFNGWDTEKEGSDSPYENGMKFRMGASDMTLYAQWEPDRFKITYHGNGNDTGSVPGDTLCDFESEYTVSDNSGNMAKTGYSFDGWNSKADGKGTAYPVGTTIHIGAENMDLFAQWNPNTYHVTFDKNASDATGEMETQEFVFGSTGDLTDNGFSRTGYSFAGWAMSGDGVMKYGDEAEYTTGAADATLFARWDANTYYITFFKNDDAATGTMNQQEIVFGESANLTANSFIKTGWRFTGWAESAEGNGVYSDNAEYEMLTEGTQLYAKWEINRYQIIYDGNFNTGGSVPAAVLADYGTTIMVSTGDDLENRSCVFIDWNTAANGIGVQYGARSELIVPDSDITLYAQWGVEDEEFNVYRTVKIGTQLWTAENIATSTSNVRWYGDDIGNRWIYGGLYRKGDVSAITPPGWHLPSSAEWITLQNYLTTNGYNWDSTSTGNKIAKSLASESGWTSSEEAGHIGNEPLSNNRSGFSAVPGGYFVAIGESYNYLGERAYWWSSDWDGEQLDYVCSLSYDNAALSQGFQYMPCFISVRFIRDDD